MTIQPTLFWVEDSTAYFFNTETQQNDPIHYKILYAKIVFICPISRQEDFKTLKFTLEGPDQILDVSCLLHHSLSEDVEAEIRYRTLEAENLAKLQHIEQEILDRLTVILEEYDIPLRASLSLDSKSPVRSKRLFLQSSRTDILNDLYRAEPSLYQLTHGMFRP